MIGFCSGFPCEDTCSCGCHIVDERRLQKTEAFIRKRSTQLLALAKSRAALKKKNESEM
jgi:hypothetical protein